MLPSDILMLHVESSSRCNASCPACPRNNNGVGLASHVLETDLSTSRFEEVIEQLPGLKTIQFCGNFGDPVIGINFLKLVDIAVAKKFKIQIHTNGSLRNQKWWTSLADKLANVHHDVWFGIDGIGKTHEIYRQGTNYNKIIKNAVAFINAGGYATWQFIPFAHNQHQVKEALRTSQSLGFKKFKLVRLFRKKMTALHWKTYQPFEINPPLDIVQLIRMPGEKLPPTDAECMHRMPTPSVYLNAQGGLSWCCYRVDTNVDSVQELLNLPLDFEYKICVENCGKKENV